MSTWIFNLYGLGFILDGLLSVVDSSIRLLGLGGGIPAARNVMAGFVFLFSLGLVPFLILTPRLPGRWMWPQVLFTLWAGVGGCFPLDILLGERRDFYLSLLQFVIGAGLWLWAALAQGGIRFLLPNPGLNRPFFTWRHLFVNSLMAGVAALLLLLSFALHVLSDGAQKISGNYIQVKADGLYLMERSLKKEGREVRLIGMMHLGRKSFYEDIKKTLPENRKTLVLLEGVSDRKKILNGGLGMDKLADSLGLAAQQDSVFMREAYAKALGEEEDPASEKHTDNVDYRRADMDMQDFRPSTLDALRHVSALIRQKNWRQMVLESFDPRSPLSDKQIQKAFWEDVYYRRNARLMHELNGALAHYDVVIVPWGAMHQPFFESELLKKGFKVSSTESRLIVSFWKK